MSKALPTISLAKAEPKDGSKEWLHKVTHEHSKTEPLELERRRLRLSALATNIDRCIRSVQTQKKIMLQSSKQMLVANEAARKAERAKVFESCDTPALTDSFDAETNRILSEMKAAMDQQELQYEITIATLTGSLANIEGHCLVIDCVSLRHDAINKGKTKYGKVRWSLAEFMHDMGMDIMMLRAMTSEMYKSHGDASELEKELVDDDAEADEDIVSENEATKFREEKKEE
jgi:hypothetical protein